jgi:arylsulfatase A-like enzyme
MTGRNPNRMGTFSPGAPIRAQELTVARVLQSAGYATGHFGKWHLNGKNGDKNTKDMPGRAILAADPLSPGRLGFDEWVSADNFFDLDPVLGRQGVPEKFHGDSSDVTTDEALKFIRKVAAGDKPFLAVVWFGSPHVPHEALPADKAPYSKLSEAEQNYYGEIAAVDRSVGRVRTALRDLQVADNTLLWYCSDNGGHEGPSSTGNLRGEKGTLWEGGLRVPSLIEWPARITAPSVSDMPCCTFDMYSTILDAAGAVAKDQVRPLDGISLLPLIDGKMTDRGKPIPFWNNASRPQGHVALLDWPYKLHLDPANRRRRDNSDLPALLLFDVAKDPKETTDLAEQQPERVAKMKAQLEAWQASVRNSLAGEDYGEPLDPPAKKKKKNAE